MSGWEKRAVLPQQGRRADLRSELRLLRSIGRRPIPGGPRYHFGVLRLNEKWTGLFVRE